jgi:hypothetical protein
MTKHYFITWLKSKDAEFRAAYEAETGEAVQVNPKQATWRYMVGSSRITQENIDNLTGGVGSPEFYDTEPSGFTDE